MALASRGIVYRGTFLNRHPAPGCRRCAGGAYRVGIASTPDCNKYCILVADSGLLHWLLVAAMLAWWMARGRKPGRCTLVLRARLRPCVALSVSHRFGLAISG